MMSGEEARQRIKDIQGGSGLDRNRLPEKMRGEMAHKHWDDWLFGYGMEYGYLLAMLDVLGEAGPIERGRSDETT